MTAASPGWVYVLTNPGLPGVVKIGLTTRDTSTRSTELLREYGTVYPFALASRHAVSDCIAVEAATHRLLDRCRLPASELFRCEVATAQRAVLTAAGDVLAVPRWRRLWRSLWLRRRPAPRPAYRRYDGPYWRRRRGSPDGLYILGLIVVLAVPLVLLKPVLPSWLPVGVVRLAVMLEHLRQ